MARDDLETIRITKESKKKIKKLGEKYGYKDVTVLEYLLKGKIDLKEFNI